MKSKLFTEDGTVMFMAIRDNVKTLLKASGAITMGAAITGAAGVTGDSWTMLACVDRMVELGEIREIQQKYSPTGQNRIFMSI